MGTWGTAISSNDTFEDVKLHFFDLYNRGDTLKEISNNLITEYSEIINDKEECHNFWFALALCQWECKALEDSILEKVSKIIISGTNIELWKELKVEKNELKKRQTVLEKFLKKIKSEKKTAKKRIKIKLIDSLYEKGDCLTFKLSDGSYGGAFVLASEQQTESGFNLIAVTNVLTSSIPSLKVFKTANILIQKEEDYNGKYVDTIIISWFMADFIKYSSTDFQIVGQLPVETDYYFETSKNRRISQWDMIPEFINRNSHYITERSNPSLSIKLSELRRG